MFFTYRRVQFGQMIGCENQECPYEWFHNACVGFAEDFIPPEDMIWYCSECSERMQQQAQPVDIV